MSVDPASVWYIARNGEIVWQGTANQLLNWIETGAIEGNEAAWSEGFTAWVSVHLDPKTQWIRAAVAQHDERTGEPTEFSNPEGTEALQLPIVAEEGESPFAGPRPQRNQAQTRAKGSLGLPLGLIAGIGIGLAAAYGLLINNENAASTSSIPANQASSSLGQTQQAASDQAKKKIVAPSATADQDTHDAGAQIHEQTTQRTPPKASSTQATKTLSAKPQSPNRTPVKSTVRAEQKSNTTGQKPPTTKNNASTQVVRIIQKKKTGVQLPQDSANRNEEIKRSMKVRKGIWDACVRRAQKDYPALVGRLIFSISVTKEGKINGVAGPQGNQGAQYAAACLLGEFDNLTFPPGRAAQVQFPYTTP